MATGISRTHMHGNHELPQRFAEESHARFSAILGWDATEEMIGECVRLDASVFEPSTCATLEQCLEWWNCSPGIYLLVQDKMTGAIAGYINHMAVVDEVANRILTGNLIDPQISCNDIAPLEIPGLYRLFLCSIVIDRRLRHSVALRVLCDAFVDRVYRLAQNDIYFSDIIADAFTSHGQQLCRHIGMKPICSSVHRSIVFRMTMFSPQLTPITTLQRRIHARYKKKAAELSLFASKPEPSLHELGVGVKLADIPRYLVELDLVPRSSFRYAN
jgi:hypothetical protein